MAITTAWGAPGAGFCLSSDFSGSCPAPPLAKPRPFDDIRPIDSGAKGRSFAKGPDVEFTSHRASHESHSIPGLKKRYSAGVSDSRKKERRDHTNKQRVRSCTSAGRNAPDPRHPPSPSLLRSSLAAQRNHPAPSASTRSRLRTQSHQLHYPPTRTASIVLATWAARPLRSRAEHHRRTIACCSSYSKQAAARRTQPNRDTWPRPFQTSWRSKRAATMSRPRACREYAPHQDRSLHHYTTTYPPDDADRAGRPRAPSRAPAPNGDMTVVWPFYRAPSHAPMPNDDMTVA